MAHIGFAWALADGQCKADPFNCVSALAWPGQYKYRQHNESSDLIVPSTTSTFPDKTPHYARHDEDNHAEQY